MVAVLLLFGYFLAVAAVCCLFQSLVVLAVDGIAVAANFLIATGLIAFAAGGLILAFRGVKSVAGRSAGYGFLAVVWTAGPFFLALPLNFAMADLSYFNAYIETVSMFTTTGFTLIPNLDAVPKSVLLWRSIISWLGGAVTIVTILVVMTPAAVGGMTTRRLQATEFQGGVGHVRFMGGVRAIIPPYAIGTLAVFVALVLSGLPELDALGLALGAVSTGGVAIQGGDISRYASPASEWILIFAMIFGATNILLYPALFSRKRIRRREHASENGFVFLSVALLAVPATVLLASGALNAAGLTPVQAVREGLFIAASLVSTTGYELRETSFTVLPFPVVLFVAFIGGAALSTAGGIKVFRLFAMLRQAGEDLKTLVYPHGLFGHGPKTDRVEAQTQNAIWASAASFALLIAFVSVILAAESRGYMDALAGAIAVAANFGPLYVSVAPSGEPVVLADMSWMTKTIMAGGMILGRTEILAILGLANVRLVRA